MIIFIRQLTRYFFNLLSYVYVHSERIYLSSLRHINQNLTHIDPLIYISAKDLPQNIFSNHVEQKKKT